MKFTIETITPRRAKEILEVHLKVAAQRKVMPGVVNDYARMMAAGQWGLTHQGICIADNGELTDGQHRLLAVIQSGVSIRCLVSNGYEQRICCECHRAFTMTEREIAWFQHRDLELPRRCQGCRKQRRDKASGSDAPKEQQ